MMRLFEGYVETGEISEMWQANAVRAAIEMHMRDMACAEPSGWFVRLYGADAGNLALKVISLGGRYPWGGSPQWSCRAGKLVDFLTAISANNGCTRAGGGAGQGDLHNRTIHYGHALYA